MNMRRMVPSRLMLGCRSKDFDGSVPELGLIIRTWTRMISTETPGNWAIHSRLATRHFVEVLEHADDDLRLDTHHFGDGLVGVKLLFSYWPDG